jgi:hypothetical protein
MRFEQTMNRKRQALIGAFTTVIAVGLTVSACNAPPLQTPMPVPHSQTPIRVAQNLKNQVDILFMIDNSNSMSAMQDELKNRFPQFFKVFSDLATQGTLTDLHIGVVTSDYGAGATGAPGCSISPGGQQGKLQGIGAAPPAGCIKPLNANFIQYQFAAGGMDGPNNLPKDATGKISQDLIKTFTCMASVGATGCGFEHQMESVYAALHGNPTPPPENMGFLRDGALLVVVFVTNEDDSSAPPTTDMFDKMKTAEYGFEDSYRQTRFGVVCCPPGMSSCTPDQLQLTPYGDSMGPLAQCQSAPNPDDGMGNFLGPGREYDISRYINFFKNPISQGGVKANPFDVILAAVDAPDPALSGQVQIILSNPGTAGGTPYGICPALNEQSNPPCVPVLQHSCQNVAQPVFFGDPAVRLNTVVRAVKNNSISSICDNDYTNALKLLANLIVSQLGLGCIPSALPRDPNGNLITDCVVEDVTVNTDGTTTTTEIAQCDAMTPTFPCWKIEMKDKCAPTAPNGSPDGVGVTIDRNGMMAAPNTTAQVFCATQ